MKGLRLLFFIILAAVYGFPVLAQIPSVTVKTDTNNVLIGDHVRLVFELKTENKAGVIWPVVADSIGKLQVINRAKPDTVQNGKQFLLSQSFTVTCFDAGNYSVPSFTFGAKGVNGDNQLLFSEPVNLRFNSIPVDTTKDIKDIKGPLSPHFNLWDYLAYILITLVVVIVLVLVFRFWVKRKVKDIYNLDYDPNIPPHVLALEAFQQLAQEKLWQSGHVKQYYIRLTDIVRVYMRRQFGINAMEMITSEILKAMKKYGFDGEFLNNMAFVFETADFVKFAKHEPLPDVNEKVMNLSVDFVKRTIPINKPEAEANQSNPETGEAQDTEKGSVKQESTGRDNLELTNNSDSPEDMELKKYGGLAHKSGETGL